MRRFSTFIWLLFFAASGLSAKQNTFEHVKIHRHRSADKRVLIDKIGTLTFDDTAHKLTFKSGAGDHVEVGYDDVIKAVFEVTTHMRGGALAEAISGAGFPGLFVGTAMAGEQVNDYWFHLDYKNHDRDESVLLEVPKKFSAQVIAKANHSIRLESDRNEVSGNRRLCQDGGASGTELQASAQD